MAAPPNASRMRPIIAGVTLAFLTLACSIGLLTPADPFFTAPNGGLAWTPTPPTNSPAIDIPPALEGEPVSSNDPMPTPAEIILAEVPSQNNAPLLYYTQAGDTLPVVAVRFGVLPSEIESPDPIPETALLHPQQLLIVPNRLANTTSPVKLLPDSEVIFSPSAADFDVDTFVNQAGGYLSTYREWLGTTEWTSGAQIVKRIALENSINPRLLLSLLEYQSGWVYGQPSDLVHSEYPMGKIETRRKGLYMQLAWAVNQISIGYYGWREGLLTEIRFSDGVSARLAPSLNAGTVALQYYLAQIYGTAEWIQAIDSSQGLPALHEFMFGNPWIRALDVEPLYPPDLTQPRLILPFMIGQLWSFSGGPHGAWEHDGARAALDFAPGSTEPGCSESDAWVLAASPGLVTRAGHGVVVLDLDGDGLEHTGWALLYLHLSDLSVQVGDWIEITDLLGHPSCEGGIATGTHIHIARKYNGEWIPADGPLPFDLGGWVAHAGANPYEGTLTKNGETVLASVFGSYESRILREREEP